MVAPLHMMHAFNWANACMPLMYAPVQPIFLLVLKFWLVEVELYLPVTLFTQRTFSPEWVSWFSPRIAAGACQFATGLNRWKPSISF